MYMLLASEKSFSRLFENNHAFATSAAVAAGHLMDDC